MKFLKDGIECDIITLLLRVEGSCVFITPDITPAFSDLLIQYLKPEISLKILIRFSEDEIKAGHLDYDFISKLESHFKHVWVGVLEELQAKLYVFDKQLALLSASDLTQAELSNNNDYGTLIDNSVEIENINSAVIDLLTSATDFAKTKLAVNRLKFNKEGIGDELINLLQGVEDNCVFITPYISPLFSDLLIQYLKPETSLKILIRFSEDEIKSGHLDYNFVNKLNSHFKDVWVGVLEELQAKLYVFDKRLALLSSADLAQSELSNQVDYGTLIDNSIEIENINSAVNDLLTSATDFAKTNITIKQSDKPTLKRGKVSKTNRLAQYREQRSSAQRIFGLQPYIKGQEAELVQQINRISRTGKNIKLQAHYEKNGIPKDVYVIVNSTGSTTEYPFDRIDNHIESLGVFNKQIDEHDTF